MKPLRYLLATAALIGLFGAGYVQTFGATPALTVSQGGTGTSSPSGILSGDNGATPRLSTVIIGNNLTFSANTLSASAFSTTSADYWKTQRDFFSTTSASYFASLGLAFSTTSADAWKLQRDFFSTTSAAYFSSLGLAFSTTSANAWSTAGLGFSTTSANYWSSVGLGFSTTSASAFSAAGLAFSTTSSNYWASLGLAFSTSSGNAFAAAGLGFSTTSANWWATVTGATFPFTPTSNFNATANSTSTPLWLKAGLQASTTVQLEQLVISTTTATSTIKAPLLLDNAPTNLSNFLNITASKSYPASVTTGGMVHIDNGSTNSGPALEVVSAFGSGATGRAIVFNETNLAYDQDFIVASSSATGSTAVNIKCQATGKGCLKIEYTGGAGNPNASAISIDMLNGIDSQGIRIQGAAGSNAVKLFNIVNSSAAQLFNVDQLGNASTTGTAQAGNFLALGSSTLQSFTSINATSSGSLYVTGPFATTTLFYANGLTSCAGASNAVTWSAGLFGCNSISSTGSGVGTVATSTADTRLQIPWWDTTSGYPAKLASANYFTISTTSNSATLKIGVTGVQNTGAIALEYAGSVTDNTVTLQAGGGTSGAKTITVPALSGTLAISASGGVALDASGNITNTYGYPFTPTSDYNVTASATSTQLWARVGLFASSTSYFDQINVGSTTLGLMSTSTFFGNLAIAGLASTTNLIISSLGPSSGQCLTANSAGQISSTPCTTGSVGNWFTPTTSFTAPANSTSTLILFTAGISASSTINFGNALGSGLTFSSATGKLGLGTTSPYAQLSIFASSTSSNLGPQTLFAIASTTGPATTTLFQIDNAGNIIQSGNYAQFGTGAVLDSLYCALGKKCLVFSGSDNTLSGVNIEVANTSNGSSAYATYNLNNNLTDSSGLHYAALDYTSSGYTDTSFGTALAVKNAVQLVNSDGPITFNTSTTTTAVSYVNFVVGGAAVGNEALRITGTATVGIGTTTPWAKLSVQKWTTDAASMPLFAVASSTLTSTTTAFYIDALGQVVSTNNASSSLPLTGVLSPGLVASLTYSTSTAWSGTTTIPTEQIILPLKYVGIVCKTNAGTLNVNVYSTSTVSGTLAVGALNASTTNNFNAFQINNSFAYLNSVKIDIGTPAGGPTQINCTVLKTITPK